MRLRSFFVKVILFSAFSILAGPKGAQADCSALMRTEDQATWKALKPRDRATVFAVLDNKPIRVRNEMLVARLLSMQEIEKHAEPPAVAKRILGAVVKAAREIQKADPTFAVATVFRQNYFRPTLFISLSGAKADIETVIGDFNVTKSWLGRSGDPLPENVFTLKSADVFAKFADGSAAADIRLGARESKPGPGVFKLDPNGKELPVEIEKVVVGPLRSLEPADLDAREPRATAASILTAMKKSRPDLSLETVVTLIRFRLR